MKTITYIIALACLLGSLSADEYDQRQQERNQRIQQEDQNRQQQQATRRAQAPATAARRQAEEAEAVALEANRRINEMIEAQQRQQAAEQQALRIQEQARAAAKEQAKAKAAERRAAEEHMLRVAESRRSRQPGAVSIAHRTRSDGTVLVVHDGGSRILPNIEEANTYMNEVRENAARGVPGRIPSKEERDAQTFEAAVMASRDRAFAKYPSLTSGPKYEALIAYVTVEQEKPERQAFFQRADFPELIAEEFMRTQLAH